MIQERGTGAKVGSVGTLRRKKRSGREEREVRDDETVEEEERYLEIAMYMERERKKLQS